MFFLFFWENGVKSAAGKGEKIAKIGDFSAKNVFLAVFWGRDSGSSAELVVGGGKKRFVGLDAVKGWKKGGISGSRGGVSAH